MRIFKATYMDRKGNRRESAKWYLEFRDHNKTVRRLPCFEDKKATVGLGRRIERLIAIRSAGDTLDMDMRTWLEFIPNAIKKRLANLGLVDSRYMAASKAICEHVEDYCQYLRDKNDTEEHVAVVASRVKKLLKAAKAINLSDVTGGKVHRQLAKMRGTGLNIQTSNHYLTQTKSFFKWLVEEGRLFENPLTGLKKLNVEVDRRRVRRALSADELRRLLSATRGGGINFTMTGPARAMVYRLAMESGLRAKELRSLTKASFALDTAPPTVTVIARRAKNRRLKVLPLRQETAQELRSFLAGRLPEAKAFPGMPKHTHTAEMLRGDLRVAGIPYVDDAEEYADFHCLRHSFASLLAEAEVHPKIAQELLRHSDINLTMSIYTHAKLKKQAEALELLPDLSPPAMEEAKATGTNDQTVLASCLAFPLPDHARSCTPMPKSGPQETPVCEDKKSPKPPDRTEGSGNIDGGETGILSLNA